VLPGAIQVVNEALYASATKIVAQIPELVINSGVHDVCVELCFNGQQYSESNKLIKVMIFEPNLGDKERTKMEDDFNKARKA